MAEINYNIILKNETSGTQTPVATKDSAEQGQSVGTSAGKNIARNVNNQESMNATLITFQQIKPFVQQAANNYINNMSLQNGAVELQERTNAALSIVGSASGVVAAGMASGPIGALLAVTALTVSAAYANYNLTLKNKLEQENNTIKSSRYKLATDRSRR